MALQKYSKLVIESEPPYYRDCIAWKIHHFSCFGSKDGTLRSCQFSTNSGQVWQLELSTTPFDIFCHCTLLWDSTSTTDVYWTVYILDSINTKQYTVSSQHKVVRGKKFEIWKKNKEKILDFVKTTNRTEEDVLALHLMIAVGNEDSVEVYNSYKFADRKPQPTLNSSVTKLLTNNSLTDVTLKVKEKEFKAHKVVLAAMSPVFEAMFQEGYKEHEDNYVNIEDMDSDVFEVFLRYLYSGQVDKLEEMFTVLLAAADKYDVQPLRDICIQHMAKNISFDNAVDMLALADRHSVESVKSLALQFIKLNFADFVKTKFWASFLENYPHDVKRMRPLSNKTPL